MEEFPQDNIFSDTSNNNIDYDELFQLTNNEFRNQNINEELLKSKDNTIKQLKRKIQAYEKNAEAQNLKLSDYDHLLVEYNSLNKSYAQFEQELDILRKENNQLKEIINTKNQTIIDFQGLFEASKSKFDLFDQTNNSLKMKIAELESKLKMYPDIIKNNEDLNKKIIKYETKIEQMKDEYNKKEEILKMKLDNQEKLNKDAARAHEEEANELKNENLKLKNQLDTIKKNNEELLEKQKMSEDTFNNKMINKEKENEKLTKIINTLKTNINEFNLLSKTESTKQKNEIEKLKEEIKNLYKKISEKEEQNTTLTNALNQANTAINQSQLEIETRNNTINGLNEEKAQLTKQLNDKQNDFNEYQNSSQQEVEMLKQKLLSVGEEKDNLIKDNEQQINIIKQLKEDINHYETNNNIYLEEKKENDDKFNNLAQAFQTKEAEFSEEIDKLKKLNQKLLSENENLKSKYEKKINLLTLQNNEATLRVKKLINTCISLKEYVLSIERNMNNINNTNNNNNSTYVGPNNNTFQGQRFSSVQKNRDILNGMNNIINQIDSKLLNDEFLNQTY